MKKIILKYQKKDILDIFDLNKRNNDENIISSLNIKENTNRLGSPDKCYECEEKNNIRFIKAQELSGYYCKNCAIYSVMMLVKLKMYDKNRKKYYQMINKINTLKNM